MFTGLVEAKGTVRSVERAGAGLRLRVAAPRDWSFAGGESVAVSGACLTVAGLFAPGTTKAAPWGTSGAELLFELSAETLARTWFAALEPGRELNLERSLRLGDRLDGHLVSGHVDGVGRVAAAEDTKDGGRRLAFEVADAAGAPPLERFLVDKGSITVDGVSLTVVVPRGRRFDVALVPLTLERTTLGSARPGDAVNLEADLLGKWIDRLLVARGG